MVANNRPIKCWSTNRSKDRWSLLLDQVKFLSLSFLSRIGCFFSGDPDSCRFMNQSCPRVLDASNPRLCCASPAQVASIEFWMIPNRSSTHEIRMISIKGSTSQQNHWPVEVSLRHHAVSFIHVPFVLVVWPAGETARREASLGLGRTFGSLTLLVLSPWYHSNCI